MDLLTITQGCRYAPTAGLQLANAFGVFISYFKLRHYLILRPNFDSLKKVLPSERDSLK